ncbi:MAG TPA: hypothetical protein VHX14_08200 [Thermoanaerobaculia bacterium]|nr:hypothetical protein [Thermoanaerobaculia bacterium]
MRDVDETKSRWWLGVLFVVIALLHLLPVWRVEYLPAVDGASHVYNANVLRELAAGWCAAGVRSRGSLQPGRGRRRREVVRAKMRR